MKGDASQKGSTECNIVECRSSQLSEYFIAEPGPAPSNTKACGVRIEHRLANPKGAFMLLQSSQTSLYIVERTFFRATVPCVRTPEPSSLCVRLEIMEVRPGWSFRGVARRHAVVTGGDNTSRVPDHSPILSWLLNRRRCVERLAFRRFKVRAAHALEFRWREHGGHARPACCCEPSTDEDTSAICFAWCALHDVRHAGPPHVGMRPGL